MATPRTFGRGSLPNQIEFDPTRALSTAGGNGDLYRGILHLKSYSDGSPFEYHNVALKRMRWGTDDKDTRLNKIIDESHVWKRAIHPNILRFLGLLYEDGELYLVAPFAPHGTLAQYIVAHPDTNRPMLLWQVSAGIAHLHEKEIIHGDVKGANILIFNGPIAKICDFGLSKIVDGKQTTNSQYSLPWTSPERLLGEPRSFSSDVYAFGMTIYEILSGKIPFDTLDYFSCVQKICVKGEHPPKHPESSSAAISYAFLWALAERCWQVRPEEYGAPSAQIIKPRKLFYLAEDTQVPGRHFRTPRTSLASSKSTEFIGTSDGIPGPRVKFRGRRKDFGVAAKCFRLPSKNPGPHEKSGARTNIFGERTRKIWSSE